MTPQNPFFNPNTLLQMMNMSQLAAHQNANAEVMQKVSKLMADSMSVLANKQLQFAQSSMADGVEMVRDLSAASGVEDFMTKQNTMLRRMSEKVQKNVQEVSEEVSKTQTAAFTLLAEQAQANWQAATQKSAHAVKSATK